MQTEVVHCVRGWRSRSQAMIGCCAGISVWVNGPPPTTTMSASRTSAKLRVASSRTAPLSSLTMPRFSATKHTSAPGSADST